MQDINDIDRSRKAMRARIEELDRQHCKSAAELTKVFKAIIVLTRLELRLGIAAAILMCFKNLVIRTPHDTGRLRAGWRVGESATTLPPAGDYPVFKKDDDDVGRALESAISLDPGTRLYEADVLWIYNKVEYVLALNAGWSTKQAGGFIDKFLAELKTEFQKVARS